MSTVKCLYCGNKFSCEAYQAKRRKYCNQECYHKSRVNNNKGVKLNCQRCGKAYFRKAGDVKKSKFCSNQCQYDNRRGVYTGEIATFVCDYCGDTFSKRKSKTNKDTRFCSVACSRMGIRKHTGDRNKYCLICNAPLTIKQISNLSKYCSRKCVGIANATRQRTPEQKASERARGVETYKKGQQKPTKIEVKMRNALNDADIKFIEQFEVVNQRYKKTIFVCDFVLPRYKIVIECDGDFWHSLPQVIKKDRHKDAYLEACGYTVIRFTESQINKDIQGCIDKIKSHLR